MFDVENNHLINIVNSSSDQSILQHLYYITPISNQQEFTQAKQENTTKSTIYHLFPYGPTVTTTFYPLLKSIAFKTPVTYQHLNWGDRTISTNEVIQGWDAQGKHGKIMIPTMVRLASFMTNIRSNRSNAMETDHNDAEDDEDDDDDRDEDVPDVQDEDQEDAKNENIPCQPSDDQKQQQTNQVNDKSNSVQLDNDSLMNDTANRYDHISATSCQTIGVHTGFDSNHVEFTIEPAAPTATADVPNTLTLLDLSIRPNNNANNNDLSIDMNLHC